MIINNEKSSVSTGGVIHTQQFTIAATAHAFKILSSTLYKDKQGAVLRELGCNAYDAHTDNGNPEEPFYVCLPTTMNPTFKIRDFGTGIDKDEFNILYSSYFISTKQSSNDYTGAFGIGKCSFYACTDQCSIINYRNGKKYVYSAYIGDDNTPQMTLMFEEDTTERNGLEITFNVKNEDISSFQTKASEIFRYFKTVPDVRGGNITPFNPEWQEITVNGIKIEYYVNKNSNTKNCLIMGNVKYPLDNLTFNLPLLRNSIVRVPIGSVDITASRESLEQTPKTKDLLAAIELAAYPHYCRFYQDEVSKCKTYYEIICLNTEKYSSNGLVLTAKVDGKIVKSSDNTIDIPNVCRGYCGYINNPKINDTYLCHTRKIRFGRARQIAHHLGIVTGYRSLHIVESARIKSEDGKSELVLDSKGICDYIADFLKIDKSKVILIDKVKIRDKNRVATKRERYVREIGVGGTIKSWSSVTVADAYFLIKKNTRIKSGLFIDDTCMRIENQIAKFSKLAKLDKPIYIMNITDAKYFQKRFPNLQPLETLYQQEMKKYDLNHLMYVQSARRHSMDYSIKRTCEIITSNSKNNEAVTDAQDLIRIANHPTDPSEWFLNVHNSLVKYDFRVKSCVDKVENDVKIKKERLVKHYPIFAPVLLGKTNDEALAQYIKQIDQLTQENKVCVQ